MTLEITLDELHIINNALRTRSATAFTSKASSTRGWAAQSKKGESRAGTKQGGDAVKWAAAAVK